MVKPNPPCVLDLLEEVLDEKREPREYRHYPSYSSMKKADGTTVGACMRQVYWSATNEPETNPKDFTGKLQAGFGQAIHDWINKALGKSKKLRCSPEQGGRVVVDPLTKEISYRIDNVLTHQGERGGLEIKTQQSFGLQRMVREGGPKQSDILQVLGYFAVDETLSWFSLIYFGRDTGFRAEYHIYRLDGVFFIEGITPVKSPAPIEGLSFNGVVDRWKYLEGCLESKTLPPRDYKAVLSKDGEFMDKRTKDHVEYKSDFRCVYCAYQTKCWSMPDAKENAYKIGDH